MKMIFLLICILLCLIAYKYLNEAHWTYAPLTTQEAQEKIVSEPKTAPFDISIDAHETYVSPRVNGKIPDGEIARFGWWDVQNCFGKDQWMCGTTYNSKTGCVRPYEPCQNGFAQATELYGGNKTCIVQWWKWHCVPKPVFDGYQQLTQCLANSGLSNKQSKFAYDIASDIYDASSNEQNINHKINQISRSFGTKGIYPNPFPLFVLKEKEADGQLESLPTCYHDILAKMIIKTAHYQDVDTHYLMYALSDLSTTEDIARYVVEHIEMIIPEIKYQSQLTVNLLLKYPSLKDIILPSLWQHIRFSDYRTQKELLNYVHRLWIEDVITPQEAFDFYAAFPMPEFHYYIEIAKLSMAFPQIREQALEYTKARNYNENIIHFIEEKDFNHLAKIFTKYPDKGNRHLTALGKELTLEIMYHYPESIPFMWKAVTALKIHSNYKDQMHLFAVVAPHKQYWVFVAQKMNDIFKSQGMYKNIFTHDLSKYICAMGQQDEQTYHAILTMFASTDVNLDDYKTRHLSDVLKCLVAHPSSDDYPALTENAKQLIHTVKHKETKKQDKRKAIEDGTLNHASLGDIIKEYASFPIDYNPLIYRIITQSIRENKEEDVIDLLLDATRRGSLKHAGNIYGYVTKFSQLFPAHAEKFFALYEKNFTHESEEIRSLSAQYALYLVPLLPEKSQMIMSHIMAQPAFRRPRWWHSPQAYFPFFDIPEPFKASFSYHLNKQTNGKLRSSAMQWLFHMYRLDLNYFGSVKKTRKTSLFLSLLKQLERSLESGDKPLAYNDATDLYDVLSPNVVSNGAICHDIAPIIKQAERQFPQIKAHLFEHYISMRQTEIRDMQHGLWCLGFTYPEHIVALLDETQQFGSPAQPIAEIMAARADTVAYFIESAINYISGASSDDSADNPRTIINNWFYSGFLKKIEWIEPVLASDYNRAKNALFWAVSCDLASAEHRTLLELYMKQTNNLVVHSFINAAMREFDSDLALKTKNLTFGKEKNICKSFSSIHPKTQQAKELDLFTPSNILVWQ